MAKMVDIIMPESEEGTESFLESWFKAVGDTVEEHEPLLEINTDKVTMEVAAPASGILKEILKDPNEPLEAGDILGRIEVTASKTAQKPSPAKAEQDTPRRRTASKSDSPRLSPAVRRLLEEHQLDPADISGSGRGGRITAEDVERHLRQATASASASDTADVPSRTVPHSPLRRRTARHMVDSMLKTAPHVTAVFDAGLSAIIRHRDKQQAKFAEKGVRLTYTAYFVQAAVKALQAVPEVNSRWREEALEIFEDYNIGIATATANGLIVPVLQRAQTLDLFETAQKLATLVEKARQGKLSQSDVQKGTFTITNHGMTGSLIATPIIHQPQSAILGIGKLEKRVVVIEKGGKDTTEIKPMAYVTLTIDHRALDGFQANAFLSAFVAALQEW